MLLFFREMGLYSRIFSRLFLVGNARWSQWNLYNFKILQVAMRECEICISQKRRMYKKVKEKQLNTHTCTRWENQLSTLGRRKKSISCKIIHFGDLTSFECFCVISTIEFIIYSFSDKATLCSCNHLWLIFERWKDA